MEGQSSYILGSEFVLYSEVLGTYLLCLFVVLLFVVNDSNRANCEYNAGLATP